MKKTLANNFLKLPPEIMPFICKHLTKREINALINALRFPSFINHFKNHIIEAEKFKLILPIENIRKINIINKLSNNMNDNL